MKCKICGKETESEFCNDCLTKAMKKLQKKSKKSSNFNKIAITFGIVGIILFSTFMITSGFSIPLFNSNNSENTSIPMSETIIIENPEKNETNNNEYKQVIEPEPDFDSEPEYEKPIIEPEPEIDYESEPEYKYNPEPEYNYNPEPEYEPEEVYEPTDVEICEKIIENYHKDHTQNNYETKEMACDVWNILQSKGYTSQIVLGNLEFNRIDETDYKYENAETAWIVVYLNNDKFAMDCKNGFITRNPEYFTGFFFDNPNELKNYETIYEDYIEKYNNFISIETYVKNTFFNNYEFSDENQYRGTGRYDYDGNEIMEQIGVSDEEMMNLMDQQDKAEEEYKEALSKVNEASKKLIPYN